MNKYYFSGPAPALPEEKGGLINILLDVFYYRDLHSKINHMLNPTYEDIDKILSSVHELNGFCVDFAFIEEGICYIHISLGGIKADAKHTSPKELAHSILVKYRKYWHKTREIDPAPFIPLLTDRKLIIAVPVSQLGYKTLAYIRAEQKEVAQKVLDARATEEERRAKALKTWRKE